MIAVDFTIGGFQYKLTDGPSFGEYEPRLELIGPMTEIMNLFGTTPSFRRVSLSIIGIDFAKIVLGGVKVKGVKAVVYDVNPTTFDKTKVFTGLLSNPVFGKRTEPTFISVEEFFDSDFTIPNIYGRIDDGGWDDFEEFSEGLYYPVVFGNPGRGDANPVPQRSVPCVMAFDSAVPIDRRIIVKKGLLPLGITSVMAWDDTTGAGPTVKDVFIDQDNRGFSYSYLFCDPLDPVNFREDNEIWAGWDFNLSFPADVAKEMFYGLDGFDYGSLNVLEQFNNFRVDAVINDPIAPLEWWKKQLLPFLPLSLFAGPDGVKFIVTDTRKNVDFELVAGSTLIRGSTVKVREEPIENSITLSFGFNPNPRTETPLGVVESKNRNSILKYGEKPATYVLNATASIGAAKAAVETILMKKAFEWCEVKYVSSINYPIGSLISLEDSEIGFVGIKGFITKKTYISGNIYEYLFTLELK
jgi:hypothetical protein